MLSISGSWVSTQASYRIFGIDKGVIDGGNVHVIVI